MNPDFALAPWEVPPGCDVPLVAPADGSYPAFWQGEAVIFWFRKVEIEGLYTIFVRRSDSDEVGNWVTMDRGRVLQLPVKMALHVEVPYEETQAELLGSIARQFYFDGAKLGYPGLHYLTVRGDGFCCLSCEGWSYGFHLNFDISPWSAAPIGRYLRRWLTSENDGYLSLQWLHSSRLERQEQFWRFRRGDLKQMLRLFRACLQNETALWAEDVSALEWHAFAPLRPDFDACDPRQQDRLLRPPAQFVRDSLFVTERMRRWKFLLWNYFAPAERHLLPVHNCVRADEPVLAALQIKATAPTAHEQLEARLLLHDWFHGEYAPARFAELMEE